MKQNILFALLVFVNINMLTYSQNIKPYTDVFTKEGKPPVDFVNNRLDEYDLIIFDDAIHKSLEPFEFYIQLIKNTEFNNRTKYIFIEVLSVYSQPLIDKYLNSPVKDSSVLFKIFQDDFTGYGLRYKTYFDLFSCVWDVNQGFSEEKDKIKVIGVDMPITWCGINNSSDYELFQRTLDVRDYFMYLQILNMMEGFSSNKKGIFLTNTRHAYKNIKNEKGLLYWNCGTFFNQRNPGKSYSVRLHNFTLSLKRKTEVLENKTVEGLEKYDYKWVRMENGIWDSAFAMSGSKPAGIPLNGNVFGKAKYVGNHMLNVLEGQTMNDAYDAVIFLAPVDNLHFSAMVDWIYTEDFKAELMRRLTVINDGNVDGLLKDSNYPTLREYIEGVARFVPVQKNTFALN